MCPLACIRQMYKPPSDLPSLTDNMPVPSKTPAGKSRSNRTIFPKEVVDMLTPGEADRMVMVEYSGYKDEVRFCLLEDSLESRDVFISSMATLTRRRISALMTEQHGADFYKVE